MLCLCIQHYPNTRDKIFGFAAAQFLTQETSAANQFESAVQKMEFSSFPCPVYRFKYCSAVTANSVFLQDFSLVLCCCVKMNPGDSSKVFGDVVMSG